MHSINKHNQQKLAVLLKQDRKIFRTKDLELLWHIDNKNTLYSTLHRYTKKGYLIPIQRNLYSTVPLNQLNPIELGSSVIHQFSYLTTETVLVRAGYIFQHIPHYTFVSNQTKKFTLNQTHYLCRQLKDQFLYQSIGITTQIGYKQATPERAVADLLYYNPHYHFDASRQINWPKVKKIQQLIGY